MRLLYTPIKNYSHTVEAVIAYAGVADRIEPVATRPFDPATRLWDTNPLGTVPALITDDGEALYGGPVIYEFLDSLHARPRLYPAVSPARWTALRQAWMADGMFDATVRLIVEAMEPAGTHRRGFIERCWRKVLSCLDQLEIDAAGYGALTIGQVRAVGALAFLDLKMPGLGDALAGLDRDFAWRVGRPVLAGWYDRVARDPIFGFNMVTLP
jgi:glutathione S-transferase